MMPPASAIAIRSSRPTGYIANATAAWPDVHEPLELCRATNAAHEVDALVRAHIADLQERLQHFALQHFDIERIARAVPGAGAGQLECVPRAGRETSRPVRAWCGAVRPAAVPGARRPLARVALE